MFIKLLLSHGCIGYYELRSDLMQIIFQLYQTSIECQMFKSVFNSYVSCFFQTVVCESEKLNLIPQLVTDNINIKNSLNNDMIDFLSFSTPLEQDFTKSSKGYSRQNKDLNNKIKLDTNSNIHCNFKSVEDSNELYVSDDENCDPVHDSIISRYFDSLQDAPSVTNFSCNDKNHNFQSVFESDSDDSVAFSKSFFKGFTAGASSDKNNLNEYDTMDLTFSLDYDFRGFINPCFEDDDDDDFYESLKNVNNKWEDLMQDISSEPRQPKRVTFMPYSDLVTVQLFEPDDDEYKYSLDIIKQISFNIGIEEFEEIMKPYLTPEHRAKFYQRYYSSENESEY